MHYGQTMPDEYPAAVKHYRRIEELIPAHWTEGEVVANGIRQHYYRTGGEKPPLVLLHGILAGGITWLRVASALERDYDVILLDARGHGGSQRIGASEMSYQALVEDVAEAIGALGLVGLERPFVLGHSMGGAAAAMLALAHPGLLRAIVLEDSAWGDTSRMPAIGSSEGYNAWLTAYIAYLERLKTQTHEERTVAALSQMPPGPTGLWPEEEYVPWVEAQAQLDLELARRGPALWSSLRPEQPLAELVGGIACPILLLTGNPARGGSGKPEVIAGITANWRDGRHVAFEDAGHLIHLDAFDRYIEVVGDFLREQAAHAGTEI